MILIDHCERLVADLTILLSNPKDVEAESFFAMLSLTNIIYFIYLNDLDWLLWALNVRPYCERLMANIFGGDGVWTFIKFNNCMIFIDRCERLVAGLMIFLSSP